MCNAPWLFKEFLTNSDEACVTTFLIITAGYVRSDRIPELVGAPYMTGV